MNNRLVQLMAAIAAEQTRIIGMQTANSVRLADGLAPAYSESDFMSAAAYLDRLAQEAINS